MKKSLYSLSIATVLALASISVQAAGEDLIYVAVEPCRIVDTRNAGGAIKTDTSRVFLASGNSSELAAQGGTADCLNPKGSTRPLAVSAYVLAVPPDASSTGGVLTAFPAGQPNPPVGSGSTVNFAAQQVIGNTTTITLCDTCAKDFAILSRNTKQQVVVDVQGYFYPAGGPGSCPADMVAAGSVCVDKYEASVWDAASGGTQYGVNGADYLCPGSGTGCGAGEANPIFARSEAGVTPSAYITWYQAQQACANVGKRLATTVEWQMAASGTASGVSSGCNFTGSVTLTGSNAGCDSTTGAADMIGNLWEWNAELETGGVSITTTNNGIVRALGNGFNGAGDLSIRATKVLDNSGVADNGPQTVDPEIGLRCAF